MTERREDDTGETASCFTAFGDGWVVSFKGGGGGK